jgi:hypothetical protein
MIYLFQNGKVVEMKEISDFKDDETYYLLTDIEDLPAIHQPVARGIIWNV